MIWAHTCISMMWGFRFHTCVRMRGIFPNSRIISAWSERHSMAGWTSRQRMLALWVTVVTTLRYVRNCVLTASILRPQLLLLIAVQHYSCALHNLGPISKPEDYAAIRHPSILEVDCIDTFNIVGWFQHGKVICLCSLSLSLTLQKVCVEWTITHVTRIALWTTDLVSLEVCESLACRWMNSLSQSTY